MCIQNLRCDLHFLRRVAVLGTATGTPSMARNEVSAQLGQLLLRGWRMMAESCSDCAVPYMRNPNTGEQLCVGCKQSPPTAAASEGPASTSAGPKAADTSSTAAAAMQPPTPSPREPVNTRQLPAGASAQGMADGSSSTGVPAGAGASAAAEAPDDPGTAQQQATGAAAAAAADVGKPTKPSGAVAAAAPPSEAAAAPPEGAKPRPQDAAAAVQGATMGQLLLKGWMMAADGCPTCQVPYMCQPRTKQRVCVSCANPNTVSSSGSGSSRGPTQPAAITQVNGSSKPPPPPSAAATAEAIPPPHTRAGVAAAPVKEPPQQLQETTVSSSSSKPKVAQPAGPDVAELLQQKLVDGWILLDHTCPLCDTWLVRERATRQMWCVKCDLPVQMAPAPLSATQQNGGR